MKNAEWCLKNNINFTELTVRNKKDGGYAIKNVSTGKDIDTYMAKNKGTGFEIFRRWLNAEHVEPILDDAERRYLATVVKPFRKQVKSISKSQTNEGELICIDTRNRYLVFPSFEKGTKYKGMKVDWKYTLEELGLTEVEDE